MSETVGKPLAYQANIDGNWVTFHPADVRIVFPHRTENGRVSEQPGEVIAEFMREHGGTQAEWARRIGCSEKHLSQVINGHVRLSAHHAVRIEAHFDLSASHLMRLQAECDLSEARTRLLHTGRRMEA